jgi:transposase-like protein
MNAMKQNSGSKGRRFDEEFRRAAVALLEQGRSATQLGRELGVSTWSLGRWKKRYGRAPAPAGSARPGGIASQGSQSEVALADEVLRLRAELHAVSRQRDILKKALTIMGQDALPGSN